MDTLDKCQGLHIKNRGESNEKEMEAGCRKGLKD